MSDETRWRRCFAALGASTAVAATVETLAALLREERAPVRELGHEALGKAIETLQRIQLDSVRGSSIRRATESCLPVLMRELARRAEAAGGDKW